MTQLSIQEKVKFSTAWRALKLSLPSEPATIESKMKGPPDGQMVVLEVKPLHSIMVQARLTGWREFCIYAHSQHFLLNY